MSEKDRAKDFCDLVEPLIPIRIENLLPPSGCPDCVLSKNGAWVEFKWAKQWPKRKGPLRIKHYTEEQRLWARIHLGRGGKCFLILFVKQEWFIFDAQNEFYYKVGNLTREELTKHASFYFKKKPSTEQLLDVFDPKVS